MNNFLLLFFVFFFFVLFYYRMSQELTTAEYKKILRYYKLAIPRTKRHLKKQAETILAEKLCRCIKKVDPTNEGKSIGICTKTIFNQKGLTRGRFRCRKSPSVRLTRRKKKRRNYVL